MSIFGPRMGTWTVSSKKDPRWNGHGRAAGYVVDGGPDAMREHIKACEKKYGKKPSDLYISFYKD